MKACQFRHSRFVTLVLGMAGLLVSGCVGSPTPLAPGLTGSVGVPHGGVLTESLELPRSGPGYRRFRQKSPVYHGLPRLVRAVERAASAVETEMPGGAPLVVGDLSARSGGRIPRHNSHRTGRDVDFLFYVRTPRGIPMENPGFFDLEADGIVRYPDGRYAVLDVPRQWHFFKALLTDEEIDVQFLFMSRALEALVIDYALSRAEDLELVWRAETVMLQPGDSLPHADHVHLRVACKPDETVLGCTGGGPHWPWLEEIPYLDEPIEVLLEVVRLSDPFETESRAEPEAPAHTASASTAANEPGRARDGS